MRVPLATDWPADTPVNGQHPYTLARSRAAGARRGRLAALRARRCCRRTPTRAARLLPLTRANIIRQAFKFLGERYGWGHDYNARDCSGFVSEVYRSMGVQMPRNTSDQGVSPALQSHPFDADDDREQRLAAVRRAAGRRPGLHPRPRDDGDRADRRRAVRHPRHQRRSATATPTARCTRVHLNGVSVTPLMPLLVGNERTDYIDRITSILRIRK